MRIYWDGELEVERSPAGLPVLDMLYIGGRVDRTGLFEGRIAEVAVYDRALTGADAARRVKERTAQRAEK
jgi:hypothetical protein